MGIVSNSSITPNQVPLHPHSASEESLSLLSLSFCRCPCPATEALGRIQASCTISSSRSSAKRRKLEEPPRARFSMTEVLLKLPAVTSSATCISLPAKEGNASSLPLLAKVLEDCVFPSFSLDAAGEENRDRNKPLEGLKLLGRKRPSSSSNFTSTPASRSSCHRGLVRSRTIRAFNHPNTNGFCFTSESLCALHHASNHKGP